METATKNKSGASRNTEKRRERSKVAARCRRGKESEIFSDLASCLPLSEHLQKTLDKASIARLALTHLKLNSIITEVFGNDSRSLTERSGKEDEFDEFLNEAMGGFVFILSSDGDLTYISESVTKCLGVSQCEVMGQSIFDFTHPCDHEDIKDLVAMNKSAFRNQPIPRSGFFRMKCTITSKGRNVHLRAASYKGISCNGRLYSDEKDPSMRWFIGVGEPLSDPTDVNFPLNKQAFVTRHSMDMKCEDIAGNFEDFLGYDAEDLVGKSYYEFHHAADGVILSKSLKALYSKGQIQTERYRFLAKNGGWVWCITQATVLKSESGSKSNGIVCLHFVTSGIENQDEIVSGIQCKVSGISLEPVTIHTEAMRLPDILTTTGLSNPTPSTRKIFAPRTDDMDSGFLMPCDNLLIVSKDEPEDLTHLAPIAGDECVPLDVPLLDDLLRSFDQANLEYSMNGFFVDVEADHIPLYDIQGQPRDVSLATTCVLHENEKSLSPASESPLLLDSDPLMGHVSDNSNYFQFPSSFQAANGGLNDGCSGLIGDEPLRELGSLQNLVSLEEEMGLKMRNGRPPSLPEELSEFRAPFIPTDGTEDQDIALLYPTDFMWPAESTASAPIRVPPDANFGTNTPLPEGNPKPKIQSKFSEQNIDQITWTLDSESIFAARKPGDQPKVMTTSVFANYDTPPIKVRKMAIAPAAPPIVEESAHTSRPSLKCPFLNRYGDMIKAMGLEPTGGTERDKSEQLGLGCEYTTGNMSPNYSLRKRNLSGSLLRSGYEGRTSSFDELTERDYEMMVPLFETSLLQGTDLINALDSIVENANGFIGNM